MNLRIDRTGHRYGRLLVVSYSHSDGKNIYWHTRCACGTSKVSRGDGLRLGTTTSCGCRPRRCKHGMTHTITYKTWKSMKQRCYNSKCKEFRYYGGRGIAICVRWLNSFENFLSDMGERPEGLSIERMNNNGNYEPSNCKWATPKEQMNNTRRNVILTLDGISLSISQWARKLSINKVTLRGRILSGWTIERALTS